MIKRHMLKHGMESTFGVELEWSGLAVNET